MSKSPISALNNPHRDTSYDDTTITAARRVVVDECDLVVVSNSTNVRVVACGTPRDPAVIHTTYADASANSFRKFKANVILEPEGENVVRGANGSYGLAGDPLPKRGSGPGRWVRVKQALSGT